MDAYFPSKMKRKELEEDSSYSNFSDFALSSPARKIRRLDAELPPIVEDDEVASGHLVPEFADGNSSSSGGVTIEELENDERAIVLFNPVNGSNSSPLNCSPSNFSVSVHPDLISGFKIRLCGVDQVLWANKSRGWRVGSDEAENDASGSSNGYGSMAVVPYAPFKIPSAPQAEVASELENVEAMDAEEMEGVAMDVEEAAPSNGQMNVNGAGWVGMNEGLHQWQQHCMYPQPPQNTTTPLVWYR